MAQLAHVLSVSSNSLPPTQPSPFVITLDVTLVDTYTNTHRYSLNRPTHISVLKKKSQQWVGMAPHLPLAAKCHRFQRGKWPYSVHDHH